MTPTRDYCPRGGHSFYDFTYWGYKHPRCALCGYEDKTRTLGPGEEEDDEEDDEYAQTLRAAR